MKRTATAAEKRHMDKVSAMGCIVNDGDAHFLESYTSYIDSLGYVVILFGRRNQERLHRLIMNPSIGMDVDHINGNKKDNRRSNLRVCSHADNCKNSSIRSNNKTGVRGVWFDAIRSRWAAQITTNGKRISLGRFDSFDDAVKARLLIEEKQWGEFSRATYSNQI